MVDRCLDAAGDVAAGGAPWPLVSPRRPLARLAAGSVAARSWPVANTRCCASSPRGHPGEHFAAVGVQLVPVQVLGGEPALELAVQRRDLPAVAMGALTQTWGTTGSSSPSSTIGVAKTYQPRLTTA